MRGITAIAVALGACKFGFSSAALAFGYYQLGLGPGELQTLAFITLVIGAQAAALYVVRERGPMWSSKPGKWDLIASGVDIAIVAALALSGTLMEPLPWRVLVAVLAATAGFALILDRIKAPIMSTFEAEGFPPAALQPAAPPIAEEAAPRREGIAGPPPRRNGPLAFAALIGVVVVSLAGFLAWFVFFSPITVSVAPVETNVREQVFGLGVNFGFNVRPLPCDYPRSYRGSVSLQFRLHLRPEFKFFGFN